MERPYLCPHCNQTLKTSRKGWTFCVNYNWDRPTNGCPYKGYRGTPGQIAAGTATAKSIEPLKTPSHEQTAIFRAAESLLSVLASLLIIARAGTGKTTVIVQCARIWAQQGLTCLFLTFAKRDKFALAARIPESCGKVWTSNGAGLSILSHWARQNRKGKIAFNDDVAELILYAQLRQDGLIPAEGVKGVKWDIGSDTIGAILAAVNQVRTVKLLFFPAVPSDADYVDCLDRFNVEYEKSELGTITHYASYLFRQLASLQTLTTYGVDFAGQTFLPVYHGLRPAQTFQRVSVDEAQDQNPYNRALALKFVSADGALCAVGDDKQAIYEWRGADNDALGELGKKMDERGVIVRLPLTICRRCPKVAIRLAQKLVPDIQAMEDAPEGIQRELPTTEQLYGELLERKKALVLCRVNAPLFSLCLRLLSKGVPATLSKSNICGQLLSLIDLISKRNDRLSANDLLVSARVWMEEQLAKCAKRRNAESAARLVSDKFDCLEALVTADGITDAGSLKSKILSLFPKTDEAPNPEKIVVCSTIHGAKGSEAHTVYILSPENKNNTSVFDQVWSSAADRDNTLYVATTRSAGELVFVGPMPTYERFADRTDDEAERPEADELPPVVAVDSFRKATETAQDSTKPVKAAVVPSKAIASPSDELAELARKLMKEGKRKEALQVAKEYKQLTGKAVKLN